MNINLECSAELEADGDWLLAGEVEDFIVNIPPGAVLSPVIRDLGSQRDPDPRLVGLRARWSEVR